MLRIINLSFFLDRIVKEIQYLFSNVGVFSKEDGLHVIKGL